MIDRPGPSRLAWLIRPRQLEWQAWSSQKIAVNSDNPDSRDCHLRVEMSQSGSVLERTDSKLNNYRSRNDNNWQASQSTRRFERHAPEQEKQAIACDKSELKIEQQRLEQDKQAINCQSKVISFELHMVPSYWRTKSLDVASFIRCNTTYLVGHIQSVLQDISCRICNSPFHHQPILRMVRVENTFLWKSHCRKRREILERHQVKKCVIEQLNPAVRLRMHNKHKRSCHLDSAVNETYLLHGVKGAGAVMDAICEDGFDARIANSRGLYGAGIYFTDQACKALQYAEPDDQGCRYIIYSRVTLGRAFATNAQMQNERRPPLGYDSVVANSHVANYGKQKHREFVVYDGRQAYPEFIIILNSSKAH